MFTSTCPQVHERKMMIGSGFGETLLMCIGLLSAVQSMSFGDGVIMGPPQTSRTARFKRHSDLSTFHNFTRLIDKMMDPDSYDSKLRPDFGGEPTSVIVDMNVRSMGPISEIDSLFQMDCYFRQSWYDKRLRYDKNVYIANNNKSMLLSTHTLSKMWIPDTYITNGRGSYLHIITVPNMYIRIDHDGKISFSQRLTIRSRCKMHLKQYPLDYQTCKISIGSFGYQTKDLIYYWKTGDNTSVVLTEGIAMSQFVLNYVNVRNFNHSRMNTSAEMASMLEASFSMKRATGYYLLNIYIPCGMLVGLSWITFWLNREASAARVSLGILTVLTTVTISMSGRQDLPQIDYITALDLYLIMSMGYVLAAFVVYAGVNYFTKITKPDDCKPVYAFRKEELLPPFPPPNTRMPNLSCVKKFILCIVGNVKYRTTLKAHKNEMNSVSGIDIVSRILFPVTFVILNFLYWFAYVYIGVYNETPD